MTERQAPESPPPAPSAERVAVVSLPFYTAFTSCYPALLLQALARAEGMTCNVFHAYIDFARDFIQSDADLLLYKRLTHEPHLADLCLLPLLEGWSESAHGAEVERAAADLGAPEAEVRARVRQVFAALLERLVGALAEHEVVGLSATHYQLVPSLLLAQRLARLGPRRPRVVLGGYLASEACARLLLEHHPALDIVFYGEAEGGWTAAIKAARSGERRVMRGRAYRLEPLTIDHGSVLEQVAAVPWLARRFSVSLEFSRGCYWDQCDFCNFNAAYEGRVKSHSPAALLGEMDALHARHGQRRFQLLDTAVPHRLPRYLAQQDIRREYEVFCEIRSDFTHDDLAGLARLGQVKVQLGIESLVDAHLERMDKHATVADNVRALLDCQSLGILVTWGVFVAHPKETAYQLRLLRDRVRRWTHLPPPKYVTHCEIRAGSPLWRQRRTLGLDIQFRYRAFELILPPVEDSAEFVPVIAHSPALRPERQQLIEEIEMAVREWQRQAALGPRLLFEGDTLMDRRHEPPVRRVLEPLEQAVLRALAHEALTEEVLAARVGAPRAEVSRALDRLVDWELAVRSDLSAQEARRAVALVRLNG